ncbi:MAG: preprotein translocase subunit SecE [Peptoniphilaceae bacterium]|nr:preprotein translocase subunit SecE [Peptoniphilaceae bacterium]MDY6019425.1 preprotein translocase subunit SecE [Anaerococcus sp.]
MAKNKEGFLQAEKKEFKKINWPTKKDTFDYSLLVIIASVITGILIWGLDVVFGNILKFIM